MPIWLHRIFLFAVFFLAFSLHVRVKASALSAEQRDNRKPSQQGMEQIPSDCLGKQWPCSVQTGPKQIWVISWGEGKQEIHLDVHTALRLHSQNEIDLLEGRVWIRTPESIKVHTEFGDIWGKGSEERASDFFVWREKKPRKIKALAIQNTLKIEPRSLVNNQAVEGKDSKENGIYLQEMEENEISVFDVDLLHARTGIPRCTSLNDLIISWGRLFDKSLENFESEIERIYPLWRSCVKRLSGLYNKWAEDRLKLDDQAMLKRLLQQRKAQEERDRLRNIFRNRALLDEG